MFKKIMYSIVLLFTTFQLMSCAVNASSEEMVYEYQGNKTLANKALAKNIEVSEIKGGQETNPLWTSKISNDNFKTALEQSLMKANLYDIGHNGKYKLSADLIKLSQPLFGLDLKVTCEVRYQLQNTQTHQSVYEKNIVSSYTATFNDAIVATERLKIANEGAARENIRKLIEDLYRLKK